MGTACDFKQQQKKTPSRLIPRKNATVTEALIFLRN
jgi:hypothetical protein